MASDVLLVPIYLDALYLKTDRSVVSAMADFTRMPYYEGGSDINPDIANISEEILSQPFEPPNLQLKAGIHLHWALPDALTRGYQLTEKSPIIFPSVPNRWLITRTDKTGRTQWIVESDFLTTSGTLNPNGGINYPHSSNNRSQPYGFLGRKLLLADWLQERVNTQDKGQYLNNLTAVGYGEPTFAAFYPNCLSVFGFHDETPPSELTEVQYDVVGWYSQTEKDCLTFLAKFESSATSQVEKIKEIYQWELLNEKDKDKDKQDTLQRTLCFAQMTFAPETSAEPVPEHLQVAVAIGNTSTEALSAYLSDYCGRDKDLVNKFAYPEHLEDQLEAVQLAGRLAGKQIDIGPKFLEARHTKEFTGVQGGTWWVIRQEPSQTTHANADTAAQSAQIRLPIAVADQLHDLNKKQLAYDQDCDEIESLRKQLFADWYKYMLCAYPTEGNRDPIPNLDEVKNFVEKNSLVPLQKRIHGNHARKFGRDRAYEKLRSELHRLSTKDLDICLKPLPAPRFWQPNEPVLLLVDERDKTIKPSQRHGQDGMLKCHPIELPDSVVENHFDKILAEIGKLKRDNSECVGFSQWTQQPWHPFLLEWEVEVLPLRGKYQKEDLESKNSHPLTRNFDDGCIQDNYQLNHNPKLDQNTVDFTIRPGKAAIIRESARYAGRSILTPHAKTQLLEQIELFLEKQLLDDYYTNNNVKPEDRSDDHIEENFDAFIKWAHTHSKPVFKPILDIYGLLQPKSGEEKEFHLLAQSLSGFNDALQMQKQTLQLPIDDPLGFDDYRPFTAAISAAVENGNRVAPQPRTDFNPIRTGVLNIKSLRLLDTFGQIQTLHIQKKRIITTDAMTSPGNPHLTVLPPRIVQPARIQFRWLAADEEYTLEENDDPEMNSHPASTPICGWLLPNHLDLSLMVYDTQGRALGSINSNCQWETAPAIHLSVASWPLPNPHLHRVVKDIIQRGKTFLTKFISVIENAMDNIDPENAAQHESLALLMGRPVAVVRAKLNLELKGLPVIDQSWSAFEQDMARHQEAELADQDSIVERETGDFTRVEFPIRIGEYKQLNDGLVGYWLEPADSENFDKFYAPQAEPRLGDMHPDIIMHLDDTPAQLSQSISSPPQKLTMLIDPRGSIHATSGILPTKSIQIPAEQYAEALRKMEITFLTAPILTERGKINLPLPDEPGFAWSWLEKENGSWNNIANIGQVSSQANLTTNLELREGWLKLTEQAQKESKQAAQDKES